MSRKVSAWAISVGRSSSFGFPTPGKLRSITRGLRSRYAQGCPVLPAPPPDAREQAPFGRQPIRPHPPYPSTWGRGLWPQLAQAAPGGRVGPSRPAPRASAWDEMGALRRAVLPSRVCCTSLTSHTSRPHADKPPGRAPLVKFGLRLVDCRPRGIGTRPALRQLLLTGCSGGVFHGRLDKGGAERIIKLRTSEALVDSHGPRTGCCIASDAHPPAHATWPRHELLC